MCFVPAGFSLISHKPLFIEYCSTVYIMNRAVQAWKTFKRLHFYSVKCFITSVKVLIRKVIYALHIKFLSHVSPVAVLHGLVNI